MAIVGDSIWHTVWTNKRARVETDRGRTSHASAASSAQTTHVKPCMAWPCRSHTVNFLTRGRSVFWPTSWPRSFGYFAHVSQHFFFFSVVRFPSSQSHSPRASHRPPSRHSSLPYRADLWSTGVILYEMLFGRAPFHSETYPELISKIMSPEPVRLPAAPPLTPQVRHLLTVSGRKDAPVVV